MAKKFLGLMIVLALMVPAFFAFAQDDASGETFTGFVFEDLNGNLEFDEGEEGIAGVLVSNGIQVAQTDENGAYELPVRDEMEVFVTKPAGYMLPLDENKIPQFSYVHRPEGSPDFIQDYDGIEPTGDLPESIDFALMSYDEPEDFRFIVFGDTQVTTQEELNYLRDSAVAELGDSEALFGVAVGDLLNDPLSLFPRYQEVMGALPFPVYYLPGNHDINFDSENSEHHLETYTRYFGSPYYSFEYGNVHFVNFDNVRWNTDEGFENDYNGRVDDEQLEWFENNLSFVDNDKLIVLSMHIALANYIDRDAEKHQETNRERIYEILEEGGFENVISLAGHSHTVERFRPGEEYNPEDGFGWGTIPFPQFVSGAVCGSWWSGRPDEFGIPTSYQRCGAPKGYQVFDIAGTDYSEFWKVSGSDASMHISFDIPEPGFSALDRELFTDLGILTTSELDGVTVVANVYNGSRDVEVTMQLNGGEALPMEWTQDQRDPFALRFQVDAGPEFYQTQPGRSYHIYAAQLPEDLEPGVYNLTVTAVDPYGQEWTGTKVFDVWADTNR